MNFSLGHIFPSHFPFREIFLMNDVSQSIQYAKCYYSPCTWIGTAIFAVPMSVEALEFSTRVVYVATYVYFYRHFKHSDRNSNAADFSREGSFYVKGSEKGVLFVNWWDKCVDLTRIKHLSVWICPLVHFFLLRKKTNMLKMWRIL